VPKKLALLCLVLPFFLLNSCVTTPGADSEAISPVPNDGSKVHPDAYEPDSMKSPVQIHLDTWVSRTLHRNDKDWFTLIPKTDGILIAETDGDTDTVLELYQDGVKLVETDDFGKNTNARIEYPVDPGVAYIIQVMGVRRTKDAENAVGAYRFRITLEPMPQDSTEPNDTQVQATPIDATGTMRGYFTTPADVDWYTLTIPSKCRLWVYTEGTMDTLIDIYNSWDEIIVRDDDSGDQGNARILVDIDEPGTLYIKVYAYKGALGRYYLHTQAIDPIKPDQFENDDTRERAKNIQPGESQARNFTDSYDEDWVRLRITQEGSYDIHIIAADNYLDTYLELINSQGELITSDDDSGGYWNAFIKATLSPGTYFLRITTLDKDPLENNAYTLSVSPGR
jgi:hypothetical protein